MKKKTLLILAVLITALACLFTSCSNSVEPPRAEEYGYVTFGNGSSRTLSTEYGIKSYDDLNWYYTSHKMDSYGHTGETNTETAVPAKSNGKGIGSGSVGPFSQGAWQFTLYAYEITGTTRTLVYQGTSSTVVLKGGETKAVPVSVSLMGATGVIDLSRAYFQWKDPLATSVGDVYAEFNLVGETDAEGNDTLDATTVVGPIKASESYKIGSLLSVNGSTDVPTGYYTCTVKAYLGKDVTTDESGVHVNVEADPVVTQIFGVRVYGNATTYIKDNLVESPDTYVEFSVADQTMVAFNSSLAEIPSNPVGTGATNKTTVDFGSNINDTNATYLLTLESADFDTSSAKFTVGDNESAVASISFDLKKIVSSESGTSQSAVDTFSTPITVTTYIATGLTNVGVKYNGAGSNPDAVTVTTSTSPVSGNYYESDTGKLVFSTTHFSEYYVVAKKVVAFNYDINRASITLADAVANAGERDTVVLLTDIVEDVVIGEGKTVSIDLNGHKITNVNSHTILNKGNLTINGTGTVDNITHARAALYNEVGATATLNGGEFTRSHENGSASGNGGNSYYVILNHGIMTINGGVSVSQDGQYSSLLENGWQNGNSATTDVSKNVFLTINGGTFSGGLNTIKNDDWGVLIINGGDFSNIAQHAVLNWNDATINGGTFQSNGTTVYVGANDGDMDKGRLIVTGGTFNGNCAINGKDTSQINISGGTFSTDPSSFVDAYAVSTKNSDGTFSVIKLPVDEDGTYLINNANDLVLFEKLVNERGNGFNSKTVKLANNIDLADVNWKPIGTNADGANKFKGIFDGQGHTISNMTVVQGADVKYRAAGFFGALNGTAKNIIFDNATVTSISTPNLEGSTNNGIAVVAGSIYTSGSIEGVTVKNSRVSGNRYVGGISGYTYGSVKNCTVEDTTVTSTPDNLTGSYDNGDKAGGVVGAFWHESSYVISGNTVNNVTVKGYRDIGGIVGYANGRVTDNTVNGLTLIQDYSVLTTPRTTVEAVIGRHDGFVVDASNTANNVTVIRVSEVSNNEELNQAISAANKGDTVTINVLGNVTLDNGIANEGNNSRNITFIGNGSQTVDVITNTVNAEGGQLNYQRGSSFTFENLTIQAGEGSFDGIVCNELTFKNCTIKGKLTLYGKATFINCTFENTMDDQYSIWTWGGTDVTFQGCTFKTNGKAILLYGGASGSNPTNLIVNNCTFNDRKSGAAGKAAIEIGNDYNATYTLTVNNATVNGFAAGKNTGSTLWANKNSMDRAHLSVTVDGEKVYGN